MCKYIMPHVSRLLYNIVNVARHLSIHIVNVGGHLIRGLEKDHLVEHHKSPPYTNKALKPAILPHQPLVPCIGVNWLIRISKLKEITHLIHIEA